MSLRSCKSAGWLSAVVLTATLVFAAGAAADSYEISPAARTLSQCMQQPDAHLSVLFLTDESLSLQNTDPNGERAAGLKAALLGLSDLVRFADPGSAPQIEVMLAGFYGKVEPDPVDFEDDDSPDPPWQSLDEASVDSLLDQAAEFAGRDDGRDTDYGTALQAAKELLAQRAADLTASGGQPPCKAIVWFTDGRYRIQDRTDGSDSGLPPSVTYGDQDIPVDHEGGGQEAVDAGIDYMCRPDGLVDGLVEDNIVLFTVALQTDLSPEDSDFLRAISTGDGSGGDGCGTKNSESTGAYFESKRPEDLFFTFSGLFQGTENVTDATLCPGDLCPEGTIEFATVPGVSRFLIHASTGPEGDHLVLLSPSGDSINLDPSGPQTQQLGSATVVQRWVSDRAVEITGEFPPDSDDWVGDWKFAFISDSGSPVDEQPRYDLQLFTDVHPALVDPDVAAAIRGQTSPIEIQLVDADGQPVTEGPILDAADLNAQMSTGDGIETVPVDPGGDPGTFTAQVTVPDESTASSIYLDADAFFDIGPDTPVAPERRSFSIPVHLPVEYPSITPGELDLPSIEGEASTSGNLTITGGETGSGCVWVEEPEKSSPVDDDDLTVTFSSSGDDEPTSQGTCLKVNAGQTAELPVNVEATSQGSGSAEINLPIQLTSSSAEGTKEIVIPVRFEMAPKPNVPERLVIFLSLLTIGIGLPVLLLHLFNVYGASFTEPQRLMYLTLRVRAGAGGLKLEDGGEPEAGFLDFEPVSTSGETREKHLVIDPGSFDAVASYDKRTRVISLFRGPFATVDAGGAEIVAGPSMSLREWPERGLHEVPLALAGTWVFVRDATAPGGGDWEGDDEYSDSGSQEATGTLLLLIADHRREAGSELIDNARAVLMSRNWEESAAIAEQDSGSDEPGLFERLRGRLRREDVSDAPDEPTEPVDPGEEDEQW